MHKQNITLNVYVCDFGLFPLQDIRVCVCVCTCVCTCVCDRVCTHPITHTCTHTRDIPPSTEREGETQTHTVMDTRRWTTGFSTHVDIMCSKPRVVCASVCGVHKQQRLRVVQVCMSVHGRVYLRVRCTCAYLIYWKHMYVHVHHSI